MPSKKWFSFLKKKTKASAHNGEPAPIVVAERPATPIDENKTKTTHLIDTKQLGEPKQSKPSIHERTQKYGLFLLNPRSPDSDEIGVRDTYLLDIVAVHGITGNAYNTWTHANEKLWLRDFVPKNLPGARVFSFGYPAGVCFSRSKGNVDSFARSLLEDLKRERRQSKDQSRPIIFVCHSMGGIVVKKALAIACLDVVDYGHIHSSVFGIMFFSTPHHGSSATPLPLILASIGKVAISATSGFTGTMRTDLIQNLGKDSEMLEEISKNFRNLMTNIKIASFIEMLNTRPLNSRIVDGKTGIMNVPGERIVHMDDCDHTSICRFSDENNHGYKRVLGVLEDWADEAKQNIDKPTWEDLSCLKSLSYLEMTYRRYEADRAHPNTCGWILQHESYLKWVTQQRGLLWIKGKPGAGKSTLLAFIYRVLHDNPMSEKDIRLEFFFHGRGTALQKTSIGMFRSLLHQLFAGDHSIRRPIRTAFQDKAIFGEVGKGWEWQLKELQDLFFDAVLAAAKSRKVTIFIDALDEAGAEARELVSYFHSLNDQLDCSNGTVRICISGRHYPVTALIPGLEVVVEEHNHRDISSYVHATLRSKVRIEENTPDSDTWRELGDELVSKASGVFQWARLVVPMVLDHYEDGESWDEIHQMLTKVPLELGAVYEHILRHIIKPRYRKKTLHLMQWVYLAKRPLSVTELRYAMASDDTYISPSQQSCKDSKGFVETDARMEKLITSLSGGLAEVKHHYGESLVQFIHQSVNDFLLSNGLNFLVSETTDALGGDARYSMRLSSDEIVGRSHHRLSRSCVNYLGLGEVLQGGIIEDRQQRQQILPFIDYATTSWYLHAKKAESSGSSQEELVQQFESPSEVFKNWSKLHKVINIYAYECPREGSTLLHIACISNLQSTVRVLLENGISVEEEDGCGNRALHYAAGCGHKELVRMLLDAHADIGVKNKDGSTPLQHAAATGDPEVVKLFLKRGANIKEPPGKFGNVLQVAAREGSTTLVEFFLRNGAEVNELGGDDGTALQSAARKGQGPVVRLLLDNGADINLQGGTLGNALQAAACGSDVSVVELLLDRGAQVNAQGGLFGNALQAAAGRGDRSLAFAVVQLLLDKGAEVNAQGGTSGQALQAAAFMGNLEAAQLLLDRRANVNAQDGHWGNALHGAAFGGHGDIVQLLLDKGADVNAQGGRRGTALQAAASNGHEEVMALLLNKGANINAQGGPFGNALQATAWAGQYFTVVWLLDRGAEINAQGGEFGTALRAATARGHNAVVDLLLRRGAKPGPQDDIPP